MLSLLLFFLCAKHFDVELVPETNFDGSKCHCDGNEIRCSSLFQAIKFLIKQPTDTMNCFLPYEYTFNDDSAKFESLNLSILPTSIFIKGINVSNVSGTLLLPSNTSVIFDSSISLYNLTFIPVINNNSHSKCDVSAVNKCIITIERPIIRYWPTIISSFRIFIIGSTARIHSISTNDTCINRNVSYIYHWDKIDSTYLIFLSEKSNCNNIKSIDSSISNHIEVDQNKNIRSNQQNEIMNFCLIRESSYQNLCDGIVNLTIIHSLQEIFAFNLAKNSLFIQEDHEFYESDDYSPFCSSRDHFELELTSINYRSTFHVNGTLNIPKCMHLIINDDKLDISRDLEINIDDYDLTNQNVAPLIQTMTNPELKINIRNLTTNDVENLKYFASVPILKDMSSNISNIIFNEFIELNETLNGLYIGANLFSNESDIILIVSIGEANEIHLFNQNIVEQSSYSSSLYLHISQFRRINEFCINKNDKMSIFSEKDTYEFSKDMMPRTGKFKFYGSQKPEMKGEMSVI